MEISPTVQPENPPAPPYLQTLGNGLKVLLALGDRGALSLRELGQLSGQSRSAMHRILHTLMELGFVTRNASDDTYQLGLKIWELGVQSIELLGIRRGLSEQLRRLSREFGETAHLSVYSDGEVVYVDKVDGWQPITSYSRLGARAPAYCVGTGKVLLAAQSETELQRVIDRGLVRYSENTIVNPVRLRLELEETRAKGFSINHGEWRRDVGGIAVAIEEPLTGDLFGIGFSGPIERILGRADELSKVLLQVRETMSLSPSGSG